MNSELFRDDEINNNPNKEPCLKCGNLYSYVEVDNFVTIHWCMKCSVKYVQDNICSWSGNEKIDNFIKKRQEKVKVLFDFFEWIPYEKFEDIKQIGRGGFATICYAVWKNGILRDYDENDNSFYRYE